MGQSLHWNQINNRWRRSSRIDKLSEGLRSETGLNERGWCVIHGFFRPRLVAFSHSLSTVLSSSFPLCLIHFSFMSTCQPPSRFTAGCRPLRPACLWARSMRLQRDPRPRLSPELETSTSGWWDENTGGWSSASCDITAEIFILSSQFYLLLSLDWRGYISIFLLYKVLQYR